MWLYQVAPEVLGLRFWAKNLFSAILTQESIFGDRSDYDLVLAGEAARSLRFPPLLVGLADEVLRHVTDHGKRPFNGLHLRIEDDMVHMTTRLGGKQVRKSISIVPIHLPGICRNSSSLTTPGSEPSIALWKKMKSKIAVSSRSGMYYIGWCKVVLFVRLSMF